MLHRDVVESNLDLALPLQSLAAIDALVQMRFDALLFVKGELTVKIQREEIFHRRAIVQFTAHTKSPNAALIFCVARNRQFFAASSVVPKISPIRRSRNP